MSSHKVAPLKPIVVAKSVVAKGSWPEYRRRSKFSGGVCRYNVSPLKLSVAAIIIAAKGKQTRKLQNNPENYKKNAENYKKNTEN